MIKGRVALPKRLFHVATRTDNQYTLIEQSAHLVLLKLAITNTTQLHNYIAHISLAIAVHDVHMQLRAI